MNRNRRIATVTVAAGMAAVLTAGTVMAAQETGDQISKEETVYVNAGADGAVTDVTVSDWLKNSGTTKGELTDTSDLSDIKNVKGDETFQQDGENVTWNTDGDDIYYQGKSDKDLPVSVSIKYYLDGTEIKPEELAGKTGHLRMKVTYTNNAKQTKKIDDKDVDIYSPFVMMTGMILPGDNYTNVTVDNGKVISDGDKEMVVGVAIPGLKESLDLSSDLSDKINIPESFTMEADVTNCPVKSTYTVALTDLLKDFDFSDNEDLDELKDNLNDLDEAALKLVDGTSDLFDGVDTLDEKYKEFADGISTLQDGVGELSEGAGTLSDGISSYTSGADTLASGVQQYTKGTNTLASGVQKYTKGVDTVNDNMGDYAKGIKTLTKGVNAYVKGGNQLASGVTAYVNGAQTLTKGVSQYTEGVDTLANGTKAYVGGIKQLVQGIGQLVPGINTAVQGITNAAQLLNSVAEDVAKLEDPQAMIQQEIQTT